MGAIYTAGEQKVRPGVYRRYVKSGNEAIAGADDGKVAVLIQSDWGPVGSVVACENDLNITDTFGTAGTVEVARTIMAAGTQTLYVSRVGAGGTKGTVSLTDGTSSEVVKLTAKYEGKRAFTVTIRNSLGDDKVKEFLVHEGATLMESMTFEKGESDADALVSVINERSRFFTAEKSGSGTKTVGVVSQKEITPGTDPSVTNESYSSALTLLEPYKFNVLAVDTNTSAVHLLVHAFIKRTHENGALMIGVVGEPTSVEFDTRCTNAAAYNDERMVYVGGAYRDYEGNTVEGYKAAAVVAGMIAVTPSNKSIVHNNINGASELTEKLTNSQYEKAIKNGMILFSENGDGGVWLDSAVNTLVNPAQNQDDGWKKIKRTKVRFELFDRLDRTLAPVIGKINCDTNGIANVEQLGGRVLSAMAAENKILDGGSFKEDAQNPHKGDSAWFLINVDDIDTLEKIYLNYQLRFSSN